MSNKLSFAGEVVVVTGAGGGLGRAYALELARRGAKVVVNDLGGSTGGEGSAQGPAAKVAEEIKAAGGEAIANFSSVATPEGGEEIVKAALDKWGRIDALIANAGILRDKSFAKLEWADLEAVLSVHLRAAFYVGKPAFIAMKDSGNGGRIVYTSSASGLFGNFGQTNYAAAKMGLAGLTKTLAIEGAKFNIKVNAVSPVAGTRLTMGKDLEGDNPMAPQNVAPMAVFLSHRECPSSGEVFMATGGWYARAFVGLAEGWAAKPGENTLEGLAAHWNAVRDTSHFSLLDTAMDVTPIMEKKLGFKMS